MSRALVFVAALLALVGATGPAAACACCDGYSNRAPLGWLNGQLVTRLSRVAGCEPVEAVEVQRAGEARPKACFDLLSGGKSVACEQLQGKWHGKTAPLPKAVRKLRRLRSVHPRYVRARLLPRKAAASYGHKRYRLEVAVRSGKRWRRVHAETLIPYFDGSPVDTMDPAVEIRGVEVTLLPVPGKPRLAALFIDGEESAPGIGHRDSHVVWVKLPKKLPTVGFFRPQPAVPLPPIPSAAAADVEVGPGAAKVLNARGLRAHKKKRYRAAAKLYSQALMWDRGHVLARYNLACALARLGYPERAVGQLETTFAAATPVQAAKRRRRARVDRDLRSLRHRKDFRRLTRARP